MQIRRRTFRARRPLRRDRPSTRFIRFTWPRTRPRAVPYGVYDLAANAGWVSVGVDHDTAAFAVNSIRQWWLNLGRARYANATRLLITADGGGSNGSQVRLWKRELQKLANELGLDIVVSHLPPGTSKWNKIEHR